MRDKAKHFYRTMKAKDRSLMLPFSLEVNIGCSMLMTARNTYRQLVLSEILSGLNVVIQHLDNHLNKVNINAFKQINPFQCLHGSQKLIIHKFDPTAAVRT